MMVNAGADSKASRTTMCAPLNLVVLTTIAPDQATIDLVHSVVIHVAGGLYHYLAFIGKRGSRYNLRVLDFYWNKHFKWKSYMYVFTQNRDIV